jgi:diacylglycerol kinase (ATP)
MTLPNRAAIVVPDEGAPEQLSVLGIVFGNGAFTGGGMNLTPGATPFDGWLDLLVMGAQSVCRRISNLSRIYSAGHIGRREFSLRRCRQATVTSVEPIDVEADGEYLGSTPCTVTLAPAIFPVIVPSGVA